MAIPLRARASYVNLTVTAALLMAAVGAGAAVSGAVNGSNAGAPAGGGTWFLGGSSSELPKCFDCQATLPASGTSSFGALGNTANDQLSPNAPTVASDLTVRVDVAPGPGATRTFVLFTREDPANGLRCDVIGTATTCRSGGATLALPPASRVLMLAANTHDGAATKAQFTWRASSP